MSTDANWIRAQRGREAIRLHPDLRPDGIDFTTAAADVIADVLHAVRAYGDPGSRVDARDLLEQAARTFEGDSEDDDNANPLHARAE